MIEEFSLDHAQGLQVATINTITTGENSLGKEGFGPLFYQNAYNSLDSLSVQIHPLLFRRSPLMILET